LAVDLLGNASIVFQRSGGAYPIEYVRVTDGSVVADVTIASNLNQRIGDPNVGVDRFGGVFVVWSEDKLNNLFNEVFFRFSRSNRVLFGPVTNISQTEKSQSYEPAVATDRNLGVP